MKQLRFNDRLSTALILLFLAVLIHLTQVFTRVDNLIFDLGQKYYTSPAPTDIVIIAIDEYSLSQLGRWPWPRQVHTQLIKRLQKESPAAIGLDVIFSEPDRTDLTADAALAQAIKQAGNVVLPVIIEATRVNGQLIETLPLPSLAANAADLGRVHVVLDEDGIARSVYLFEGLGLPAWQLFAQAVLNVARKQPSQNNFQKSVLSQAEPALFSIQRSQQKRVSFRGPPGHFSTVSYVQVLKGVFEKGIFKNKIVLIGATAAGLNDFMTTPVSGSGQPMAGVEFHANVLDSIRSHRLITLSSPFLSLPFLIIITLLPLIWLPRVPALKGLVFTSLYFVLVMLIATMLPRLCSVWIAPSPALFPLLVAYPVWSWRKLEAAQRYLDQELAYLNSLIVEPEPNLDTTTSYDNFDARIEQVRAASEQLRFLQEDRKEVLAFISHDLRAPIANALIVLGDNSQMKSKLYASLSQALQLAETFLQVSRAEMTTRVDFKELDLAGITHQAIDDAYECALQKNITLERDIVAAIIWVSGNFGLLHRAILNLVLNAIKFSPENAKVIITLNYAGQHANLTVIDYGIGISQQEQSQLFKRFSRVKNNNLMTHGAGLGLYFVRTVVEKHQGEVKVQSRVGKQTCFIIRLPVLSFQSH